MGNQALWLGLGRNLREGLSSLGDKPLDQAEFGLRKTQLLHDIDRQNRRDKIAGDRNLREKTRFDWQKKEQESLDKPWHLPSDVAGSLGGEDGSQKSNPIAMPIAMTLSQLTPRIAKSVFGGEYKKDGYIYKDGKPVTLRDRNANRSQMKGFIRMAVNSLSLTDTLAQSGNPKAQAMLAQMSKDPAKAQLQEVQFKKKLLNQMMASGYSEETVKFSREQVEKEEKRLLKLAEKTQGYSVQSFNGQKALVEKATGKPVHWFTEKKETEKVTMSKVLKNGRVRTVKVAPDKVETYTAKGYEQGELKGKPTSEGGVKPNQAVDKIVSLRKARDQAEASGGFSDLAFGLLSQADPKFADQIKKKDKSVLLGTIDKALEYYIQYAPEGWGKDEANGGKEVLGYEIREPYQSEISYFKENPTVAGMAAEDGRIILNPYSNLTDQEKQAVAKNEAVRLWMRENKITPDFILTPEQRQAFQGTPYERDEGALKQTIVARIISGDPSAKATSEQIQYAKNIQNQIEGKSEPMDKMPPAAEHNGKIIRDTESDKRYQSNGTEWVEIK